MSKKEEIPQPLEGLTHTLQNTHSRIKVIFVAVVENHRNQADVSGLKESEMWNLGSNIDLNRESVAKTHI